jgi:cleavage and polyadenylation specificity factor subunit 1
MVLQTGQEITELDQSGFATQSSTVYAGNIDSFILQATRTDIRLLKGVKQLCYVALDMGGGIKSVDVCSSYIIVLLLDGNIGLLKLVGENLELSWPSLVKGSVVSHITAFVDSSGFFALAKEVDSNTQPVEPPAKKPHLSTDDEDELLYGSTNNESTTSTVYGKFPPVDTVHGVLTNWCVLCRDNGLLEIYSVPDFQLVFSARNFTNAPWTLCDSGPVSGDINTSGNQGQASVEQILFTGMGPIGKFPYLIALINKELVIYQGFKYPSAYNDHLCIRFSKVEHSVILHDKKDSKLAKHFQQHDVIFPPHVRKFANIGGYSGVFVCGSYPHWIFVTIKGQLCIHPMYIDGPVRCFAPFDNVNCPAGFLYFNKEVLSLYLLFVCYCYLP